MAMAQGAKATVATSDQIKEFLEDLVSAVVQTLTHRGRLRAWVTEDSLSVKLLAEQLSSELKHTDTVTQLNSALFSLNGGTGYVLHPETMRSDSYDPQQEKVKVKFTITVRELGSASDGAEFCS